MSARERERAREIQRDRERERAREREREREGGRERDGEGMCHMECLLLMVLIIHYIQPKPQTLKPSKLALYSLVTIEPSHTIFISR